MQNDVLNQANGVCDYLCLSWRHKRARLSSMLPINFHNVLPIINDGHIWEVRIVGLGPVAEWAEMGTSWDRPDDLRDDRRSLDNTQLMNRLVLRNEAPSATSYR